MPVTTTDGTEAGSNAALSRPLLVFGVFGVVMVAAALALWSYYGTAVFFEMVRAGFIACF